MNAKLKLIILLVAPCVASAATADVQPPKPPVLEIRADQPGPRINKTQYGVFFEEISHAGEGGLYAELISNRSFEDSTSSIPEWTFYPIDTAKGSVSLETADLLNAAQSHALKVDIYSAGTVGVANGGYCAVLRERPKSSLAKSHR